MKIAILGSGAVGGYYGGRLVEAGEDVHFLYHSEYEAVCRHGLRLESVDGNWSGPVQAWNDVAAMPPCDVALVAFKSAQSPLLAQMLPQVLGRHGVAVCLMNGLGHEEIMAQILGPQRVMAGAAFICAERGSPGVVQHFSNGGLALAPYFDAGREPIAALCADLAARFGRAKVSCQTAADGRVTKWGKLIWNVPFSGLSLYYGGVTTDAILQVPEREQFVVGLMAEVMAAAAAVGVTIDPRSPEWTLSGTRKMGAYRPSMLVDFEQRRPVEVDAIVAEPLRRGLEAGVALPLMTELLAGIRRVLAAR